MPAMHVLTLSFTDSEVDYDDVHAQTRPSIRGVFLQLLTPRCRHLTSLFITCGLKGLPPRFLVSFAGLEKLEELDLVESGAVADFDTLQRLSEMPALRDLAVQISLENAQHEWLPRLGGAFHRLDRLDLSGNGVDLRMLVEAINCPFLTRLSLAITGRTASDVLKDGLSAICRRIPTSLTEVSLHVSAAIGLPTPPIEEDRLALSPYIPPRTMPLGEFLRPFLAFLAFHGVTVLDVQLKEHTSRMRDEDACALARAWPALTLFHLRGKASGLDTGADSPILAIAGLIELARGCPRLEVLNLPSLNVQKLPL